MTVTSLQFLGFCFACVFLFVIFPPAKRWYALLIASLAFYWICAKFVVIMILFTAMTVWIAAGKIEEIQQETNRKIKEGNLQKGEKKALRALSGKKRKQVLLAALIINLGILIFFKVYNMFLPAFTALGGMLAGEQTADLKALALPLGISYYTFTSVGYLLDIYWKRYETEKNPVRFLLYVTYFPHILQGPISRYPSLGQDLQKPELRLRKENIVYGLERILLGCFKKLVIADRAGIFVSAVLHEPGLPGIVYITAIFLDAIQIYADFSGYMDIMIGLSAIMDVKLEENFNHPFLAKSVPEFWRRWHMSLGGWFRDYVYYPLTLSKLFKNVNKRVMDWKSDRLRTIGTAVGPIMITWILTGLWHGTGPGYVAWGIYYGVLITLSTVFSQDLAKIPQKLKINTASVFYRVFQTVKMLCIFMGGRLLSSELGIAQYGQILHSFFRHTDRIGMFTHGLDRKNFAILGAGILVMIAIAVIESRENLFKWFNRQNKIFCAITIYIIFFAVFLLGIYGTAYNTGSFIYQQF